MSSPEPNDGVRRMLGYRTHGLDGEPLIVRVGSICAMLFSNNRVIIGGHDYILFDGVRK